MALDCVGRLWACAHSLLTQVLPVQEAQVLPVQENWDHVQMRDRRTYLVHGIQHLGLLLSLLCLSLHPLYVLSERVPSTLVMCSLLCVESVAHNGHTTFQNITK